MAYLGSSFGVIKATFQTVNGSLKILRRKKYVDSNPISIVNNPINNSVLAYPIAYCKPFYRSG
jgi:hypothetical protein